MCASECSHHACLRPSLSHSISRSPLVGCSLDAGRIQMYGCKVKQDGKKLKITNASQIKIFKDSTESVEGVTFNLEFEDKDEAHSWLVSMVYGGAEKAE